MALWDDFLDGLTAVGSKALSPLGTFLGNIVGAGTQIGVAQATKTAPITETARQQIAENIAFDTKEDLRSNDPLLKTATFAVDKVLSPYVTRPISTIGLLTDVESPLYQAGEYEKGFQLNDIRRAYNRSESVSPMQALTKSDLVPFVGPWSQGVLSTGDIDVNKIDLWNDEDIQKNFNDNIVGKFYTGVGDFVVGNYGVAGAVKGVAGTLKGTARVTGFSTKTKTAEAFERDIDEGLLYKETNGAQGRPTASAEDIESLAKSDDINYVYNRVQQYSNNEALPDLILKTKDPFVVRDLILADKGYLPALDRLSKTAPDYLWEVADTNAYMSSLYATTGKAFVPDEVSLTRINAAFDEAIKRNPIHERIKNAFMDEGGDLKILANERYFPIEPVVAAQKIGSTAVRARQIAAAATVRDFSNVGGFAQTILGGGFKAPTTVLLRMFGTRKPLGMITYSGARPLDGIAELDAYFDDFAIFRDGTNQIKISPTQTMSASEYRSMWKARFAEGRSAVERDAVIEEFNKTFGRHVARTYGYNNMTQVDRLISEIQAELYPAHASIAKSGYAMDTNGRRIVVDPITQRQFAETRRLLPWNVIEKELIKAGKAKGVRGTITTKETINALFEMGNKWWSFDVLARPSYIPKNSLFEPILSATMAKGISFVADNAYSATKNAIKNNKNRILSVASRMYKGGELKAVNSQVEYLMDKLNDSYTLLDEVNAEYAAYMNGDVSPAAKLQNFELVKSNLKNAKKLVENIEMELGDALRPMGFDYIDVPSVANLEARVQFLDKVLGERAIAESAKYGNVMNNAKSAITKAKAETYSLTGDIKVIDDFNKNIELAYREINDVIKELGEARLKQAKTFGKSAEYKKRYYGNENVKHVVIDGQRVPITSLFDENMFGSAFRAELENGRTTELTFLGELKVGSKQGLHTRKAPNSITDINSPIYFEELAWVANRTIRGDVLADQILAGVPENELIEWALKNKSYVKSFGITSADEVPGLIRNRVNTINRYFPDARARELILNKEVTSAELQEILATKMDRLIPIHPNDFDYLNAFVPSSAKQNPFQWLDDNFSKAAGAVWKALTRPENPIRWQYADTYFQETVARKAAVLEKQNVPLTIKNINALRQAAAREAIKETEKVFYTIRRQNRFLFSARVAAAFPTASANALYRYGRFAIKNPGRVGGFLYSYHGMYSSFGVDKYGNPVTDPLKATHLVIPGTKELGFGDGQGIQIPARSAGFLLNYPSPAIWSSIPIGIVLKQKPSREEQFKNLVGEQFYETFFPYGPQTSLKSALIPTWARDLYVAITTPDNDKRWIQSWQSVWDLRMTQYEMGLGPMPTEDSVTKEARSSFFLKARRGFASPIGAPAKVDLKPFAIVEDYYNILVNKHKRGFTDANGVVHPPLNEDDAAEAAEKEMLANIPKMPVDRVRYRGSTKVANLYPQAEVYSRVWEEFPDLAKELVNLDPETVSLLTADIERDPEKFSMSVYNFLNDPKTQLPGTNINLNKLMLKPEQIEQQLELNRTWEKYVAMRDKLDEIAIKNNKTSYRQIPELADALQAYADGPLKKENQLWWEKKEGGGGAEDASFIQAQSLYKIINNEKFASKYGNHELWKDVKDFLGKRQAFALVYMNLPDNDRRKSLFRQNYLTAMDSIIGTYHPRLQAIIKRYFDDDKLKVVG